MSTTRDLINGSARLINIVQKGEVLDADDMDVAVYALKGMQESWSNNRLMIYHINQYEFPLQESKRTYTLGPGGDWDVERPMKIENMTARLQRGSLQQVDIIVRGLTVHEYQGIGVKNTPSTFPFAYYDDNAYPLRNVTFFPVPLGPCSIVLWLREPLLDLTDIDAEVNYPPGYERAFRYNLAVELAPEYGKQVSQEILMKANTSFQELERLNSVPMYLHGDGGMNRTGRNRYFNWITGNFTWSFGANN